MSSLRSSGSLNAVVRVPMSTTLSPQAEPSHEPVSHFSHLYMSFSLACFQLAVSQIPITPCAHTPACHPLSYVHQIKCLESLFWCPLWIRYTFFGGVCMRFSHDLRPRESRPLHSDAFLLIRQKHMRVSVVPDLCCFILFHHQHTPFYEFSPILVRPSFCLKHISPFHTLMMQVLFIHEHKWKTV